MKLTHILFDFDGVILDSFKPAFEVAQMQCPHLTEDGYSKRFNGNIFEDSKEEIHTDKCRHDIDFFTEYLPRMKKHTKVFDGMKEVILELAQKYTLVIISSTISQPIKEVLQDYGIDSAFDQILGSDVHKSKVEKMKMVFSHYKISSDNCIFITDTLGDINEANHQGIPTVAVTWGFQTRSALERGNPTHIVDTPQELLLRVLK